MPDSPLPADDRSAPRSVADSTRPFREQALRIARDCLIFDGHIDLPHRLFHADEDVTVRTASGDFDLVRAAEGGLNAAFFAIYVPAALQSGGARQRADKLIDRIDRLVGDSRSLEFASAPADLRRQFDRGLFSCPLGLENGAALEGETAALDHFWQRGVRYITLTHGANNSICDSSYAQAREWEGLSPFGRELIPAMNERGMMVDVSHVSDAAFDQVLDLAGAPVIASHSSCRHFTPSSERNLDDDRIQRLAAGGGLIAINFGSAFLTEAAYQQSLDYWSRLEVEAERAGIDPYSPVAGELGQNYFEAHEKIYADVDDVAAHIEHVAKLVGWEHVALGSDFDGVGDSLPTGLKDVAGYPNLIESLLRRGASEAEVGAVLGENLLRVWAEIESAAS